MLYNCLKCCRSISSRLEKCPYCSFDATEITKEVNRTNVCEEENVNKINVFSKLKKSSIFSFRLKEVLRD